MDSRFSERMPSIEGSGAIAVVIIDGLLIFSIGRVGVGNVSVIVAPGDTGQFIIPIPP